MRGKSLMFQGTGSSVGKSMLCAAVLRIFKQDGLRAAPFKAQNMALNSYATSEGLEMGRAQVTQAEAAGVEPSVKMNPVLLKPTSDRRSQVIVGRRARGHHVRRWNTRPTSPGCAAEVQRIYDELESGYDAVVIEGAGSPAEINLKKGDIVEHGHGRGRRRAGDPRSATSTPAACSPALYGTVKLLPRGRAEAHQGRRHQQIPGRREDSGAGTEHAGGICCTFPVHRRDSVDGRGRGGRGQRDRALRAPRGLRLHQGRHRAPSAHLQLHRFQPAGRRAGRGACFTPSARAS